MEEYSNKLITQDNLNIFLSSKSFEKNSSYEFKEAKWFGTKHHVEDFPEDLLEKM